MKLSRKKLWEIGKILLLIMVLSIALNWLIPTLTSEEFKSFIERLGPFGPLIVIFYTVFSHILAPLAGTPGVLLSIAVFGIYRTLLYIYFASLISACVNFYISRKFGRSWVIKLVGKRTMQEIDGFVEAFGTQILILSRVFGFALFEVISYAAGLTSITFRRYLLITAIFSLIPNSIFAFLFRDIDFSSGNNLIIWLGTLVITGIIFSFFLQRYSKKRK